MDEAAAFLSAIQAKPKDSTRRLVYADWLEERDFEYEAKFLRTEVELSQIPLDSPEIETLRNTLWRCWAKVPSNFLHTFTQPKLLLANPTPFEHLWINFDLEQLRPGGGTYNSWKYRTIPPLDLEMLDGQFRYLPVQTGPKQQNTDATQEDRWLNQIVDTAGLLGFKVPESFLKFYRQPNLRESMPSVTDCYFTLGYEASPIQPSPLGNGGHLHFYCDSQSCLMWDLYLHVSGAHCVIARDLDSVGPEYNAENALESTWFVAPSFEAFVYRIWLENQVWYGLHPELANEDPPEVMAEQLSAYVQHYAKKKRKSIEPE